MDDLAKAGKDQNVVLLPRDPESGYIFWKIGELTSQEVFLELVRGHEVEESFEITEREGGRFVRFRSPGSVYQARVRGIEGAPQSAYIEVPRREPGDDGAAFVKVAWTEEGLEAKPTEHEDEIHGAFPAGKPRQVRSPSSTAFHRS